MPLSILQSINSPGKGHGTGDDRFGHDEAAGTAWVVDGATDLTDLRLFKSQESDAAWLAEALSGILMMTPHAGQPVKAYFTAVLEKLRQAARKTSKLDIANVPPEALPIASGMWIRAGDRQTDFAWLGDCMGLVRLTSGEVRVIGTEEKADRETETSRRMAAATPEEKRAELRRIRAIQNTAPEHAIFGLSPHAADNLSTASLPTAQIQQVVLMTDGLWRLVAPYGLMSPEDLMSLIDDGGLDTALRRLREHEASAAMDRAVRFKAADDACAVYAQLS